MTDEISTPARARPAGEDSAARPQPLHPPPDARSALLTSIFMLLVFYTLYSTAEIAIPMVFAILLNLLLQPGLRVLTRARIPTPVAALAMMAVLAGVLGAAAYGLSGPAGDWLARAPESLPRIEEHLSALRQPLDRMLRLSAAVEHMADAPSDGAAAAAAPAVAVKGSSLASYLFSGTRSLIAGCGVTALMLFFLLVSGDVFLRKLVEILPNFSDKKQAVEMSREVEHNISAYLVTISAMNLLVGVATGLAMLAIGLPNALLWGSMAFLLNYVMILGPLAGLVMFFAVGLVSFPTLLHALLPPAAYLAIHVVEGEFVTPMLVAHRFTLNPVLVIGSLVFWEWMWGIPGALLAVPLLAATKIVCDRVRPLASVGHFLGG